MSSRCMTNYMKSCSFLHAHFFELKKVVEKLFKKAYGKNSFIEKTYVVGTHWNCLYVPTTYVTDKKKNYFEIYIYIKYHVRCLCLF